MGITLIFIACLTVCHYSLKCCDRADIFVDYRYWLWLGAGVSGFWVGGLGAVVIWFL